MTPEQISKFNENPGAKKGLDFIDLIQKDGYEITNYSKVAEIAELVARGSEEPLRKYYSLKDLENKMSNMEKLTTNFRFGMRDLLNEVSTIVKNDGKFVDPDNRFDMMINDIKSKLGVVQATNRLAEAKASRVKTRAAIAALDSNTSMTQEAKNAEFRRLFAIYTGPNVKAIKNAEKIANRQDENFNMNLDNKFLDKIGYDLKNVYDYLMTINLSSESKKILIDKFNNLVAMRNEYKARFNKYMSNLNLYKNTLASLGISESASKSVKKEVKPAELIKDAGVHANTPPSEPEKDTPPPEPEKDTPKLYDEVKPISGKKVTAFKKAKDKVAKAARLTGVFYITGAILVPAFSIFGLLGGVIIAVAMEKIIAQKQGLTNNKERKFIKERLSELKDELIKKANLPSIMPEEKNELDNYISEIESHLVEKLDKDKVAEPVVEDELDQEDQEVRIAREIMADEGLTPEEAADKAVEMQAEVLDDGVPSLKR